MTGLKKPSNGQQASNISIRKFGGIVMYPYDLNMPEIFPHSTKKILSAISRTPTLHEMHDKVAILLCTMQGQHYLRDQLDSIAAQTHLNWEVWSSDDGSEDGTHAILEEYERKWGSDRLSFHFGPSEGFVANFLSLTCKAAIQADYYAYADQDDIWQPDKLSRAVAWLKTVPRHIPALYCSRTRLVDADNRHIGFSPIFAKSPNFANALVQSIGGANTMVFNDAARRLLCAAGENVSVISHDWWTYMIVTGCGGQVFYDPTPTVHYRQHGANLVGANITLRARAKRASMLMRGRFRDWNAKNIDALWRIRPLLTPENRRILENFAAARNSWLVPRLVGIKRCGIHRQTLLGNMGLAAAAILNRI